MSLLTTAAAFIVDVLAVARLVVASASVAFASRSRRSRRSRKCTRWNTQRDLDDGFLGKMWLGEDEAATNRDDVSVLTCGRPSAARRIATAMRSSSGRIATAPAVS